MLILGVGLRLHGGMLVGSVRWRPISQVTAPEPGLPAAENLQTARCARVPLAGLQADRGSMADAAQFA